MVQYCIKNVIIFLVAVGCTCGVIGVYKYRVQQKQIKDLSSTVQTLDNCVTTLEKVHLVSDKGEITHAVVQTTATVHTEASASSTSATHTRKPVLSE